MVFRLDTAEELDNRTYQGYVVGMVSDNTGGHERGDGAAGAIQVSSSARGGLAECYKHPCE